MYHSEEVGKLHMCDNAFFEFGIVSGVEPHTNYVKDIPYAEGLKRFQCISIADEYINLLIPLTWDISTYSDGLFRKYSGLDHYGVTLIPPESLTQFIERIEKHQKTRTEKDEYNALGRLIALLKKAKKKNGYVISYGI